ncbi:MAG: helix-turn-helix domain-containing protein [Oscillospiraceae bacterium]|nr:helix-turn-helix domain-containing protein [Oscillospiraceae bacterium]
MRELPLASIQAQMLEAIMEGTEIQPLLDSVYEVIHLPIILIDPSFSIIAYTFPRPFYFPHWEWMAKQGAASTEAIEKYDYLDSQEMMLNHKSASIFNEGTCYGYDQACGPVMVEDQLFGYCGIMIEDADPAQVIQAADMLIRTISCIRTRNARNDRRNQSIVLSNLISQNQAAELQAGFGGDYIFFVVSCTQARTATLQYVKTFLEARGYRILGVQNDDGLLYLLYGGMGSVQARAACLEDLQALSEKYGLSIGQSDDFRSLADLPIHREQALLALTAGIRSGKGPGIYSFYDKYCDIIDQAALDYFGREVCTMPEVQCLMEEDARHGSEYAKTLETWLRCARRKSLTGQALGQHKATVANRLEKISALIGRDPALCPVDLQMGLDIYIYIYISGQGGAAE